MQNVCILNTYGGYMPLLQVRDFPKEIYELLRLKAEQERRSIAQQTIVCLTEHLQKGGYETLEAKRERRRKLLESISHIPIKQEAKDFDVVKSIREDRNR